MFAYLFSEILQVDLDGKDLSGRSGNNRNEAMFTGCSVNSPQLLKKTLS